VNENSLNIMINKPIGLFDSGVGGTSIWKEINELLPHESTIYLADSKNAPYGLKAKDEIIALSIKNTEFLLNLNCKMIVVACNTATTNAIKVLRSKFDVPFIGIEPAIKPAALHSKTHNIGILATQGTLNSDLFHQATLNYKNIQFFEQIGYGIVELIENGKIESSEMSALLKKYLAPMIAANIDYLVLGCSHYPYLLGQLKQILPSNVKIIDSGEAVAIHAKNMLQKLNLESDGSVPTNLFYSNLNTETLQNLIGNLYQANFLEF
jgi:glutamate racemase